MTHSRFIAVLQLEGQGVDDAVAVIDAQSGRCLAFFSPDFPPGHRLAGIDAGDLAEVVRLFDHGVDEWFEPRMRGVIVGTAHAILHGWGTARDARALLIGSPIEMQRQGRRFLHLLASAGIKLADGLKAFPSQRGRPANETRTFFLESLTEIALDNGMDLRLPQHRDPREGGVTPFFTFVLATIDIVLSRVGASADAADSAVRRRAAGFRWSRIALLDALERARESLEKSKG